LESDWSLSAMGYSVSCGLNVVGYSLWKADGVVNFWEILETASGISCRPRTMKNAVLEGEKTPHGVGVFSEDVVLEMCV